MTSPYWPSIARQPVQPAIDVIADEDFYSNEPRWVAEHFATLPPERQAELRKEWP